MPSLMVGSAPPVHPIIELESEYPRRSYERVHAVAVSDLVNLSFGFRCLRAASVSILAASTKKDRQAVFGRQLDRNLFFLQGITKKKTVIGAQTLTVSDEIRFRNGEAQRQEVRQA
jgi:hypothetical protein